MTPGPWRLCLFGQPRIIGPDIVIVRFDTQRSIKLLVLLALSRTGSLARSILAGLLWPDDVEDATRLRLRQELSRLKRAMGPAGDLVTADNNFVYLDRSKLETDLEGLRRATSLPPTHPNYEPTLELACQEADSDFLPGWNDDWTNLERHQARTLKLHACTKLGQLRLEQSRAEDALYVSKKAVSLDPTFEPARIVAMKAQAKLGSLTNALAEFQEMKRAMRQSLNKTPSAESEKLIESLSTIRVEPEGHSAKPSVQLPHPIDPFIGRDALIEEIAGAIQDPRRRLITLVGPGGIGKTRLALELLHRVSGPFRKAFIPLDSIQSSSSIPVAFAQGLGLATGSSDDALEYVTRSLHDESILAVIDNAEHLLPDLSQLILRLISRTPQFRVIVTSRVPLRCTGELVFDVGPLDPRSDGLELLKSMIQSFRGSNRALAAESDLAQLALLLEGNPLATRLAAPRLRVQTVQDLTESLLAGGDISASNATDLPERHRSLAQAVRDSVLDMPESARGDLLLLSYFRGGWTSQRVSTAICNEPHALMEDLLDRSLIRVDETVPEVRFRILDAIRRGLEPCFTAEFRSESRTRFVESAIEWWSAECPSPMEPMSISRLHQLTPELDNWEAAYQLADSDVERGRLLIAAWKFLMHVAHRDITVHRVEGAIRTSEVLPEELELDLRVAAASLCFRLHRTQSGIDHIDHVSPILEQRNDYRRLATVLGVRAALMLTSSTQGSVMDYLERAEELAAESKDPLIQGRVGYMRAYLNHHYGNPEEASAGLEKCLRAFRSVGEELDLLPAVQLLAFNAIEAGDFDRAERLASSTGEAAERAGEPLRVAAQHEIEARIAWARGLYNRAEHHFRLSEKLWSDLGDEYQVCDQNLSIARTLVELGRTREARFHLMRAARSWYQSGECIGLIACMHVLTRILIEEGDLQSAVDVLEGSDQMEAITGVVTVRSGVRYRESLRLRLNGHSPSADASWTREKAFAFFESADSYL